MDRCAAPQAESVHLDVTSDLFFQKEFILPEIETHLILASFTNIHTVLISHCIPSCPLLQFLMSVEAWISQDQGLHQRLCPSPWIVEKVLLENHRR